MTEILQTACPIALRQKSAAVPSPPRADPQREFLKRVQAHIRHIDDPKVRRISGEIEKKLRNR